MDVLSKKQRSYCMSNIRSTNTTPELKFKNIFYNFGIDFEQNSNLFGRPDIVLIDYKVAIFIDGCFWHGCPEHYNPPKNNSPYWKKKLKTNRKRDFNVNKNLKEQGFIVLRFWEHELRSIQKLEKKILKLLIKNLIL